MENNKKAAADVTYAEFLALVIAFISKPMVGTATMIANAEESAMASYLADIEEAHPDYEERWFAGELATDAPHRPVRVTLHVGNHYPGHAIPAATKKFWNN